MVARDGQQSIEDVVKAFERKLEEAGAGNAALGELRGEFAKINRIVESASKITYYSNDFDVSGLLFKEETGRSIVVVREYPKDDIVRASPWIFESKKKYVAVDTREVLKHVKKYFLCLNDASHRIDILQEAKMDAQMFAFKHGYDAVAMNEGDASYMITIKNINTDTWCQGDVIYRAVFSANYYSKRKGAQKNGKRADKP